MRASPRPGLLLTAVWPILMLGALSGCFTTHTVTVDAGAGTGGGSGGSTGSGGSGGSTGSGGAGSGGSMGSGGRAGTGGGSGGVGSGGAAGSQGSGGAPGAGSGGAGSGGTIAGTGGTIAGSGGTIAGSGGTIAGTGGTIAGTGGTIAGTGGSSSDRVETIGSPETPMSLGAVQTVNYYAVTTSRSLLVVEQYVTVPPTDGYAQFTLYEATDRAGPYVLQLSFGGSTAGGAPGYFASNPTQYPLVAGRYYALGFYVSGQGTATYYTQAASFPQATSFGQIIGAAVITGPVPDPDTAPSSFAFAQRLTTAPPVPQTR